jgi:hypothetical protein
MAIITKPHTFSPGAVILSTEHNSNFDTVYNDYNGGITNANISATASIAASKINLSSVAQTITLSAQPINFAKGADIISSSTVDIGSATGNFMDITGTTTITSFGTIQAGTFRILRFTGILILTHNASSLILPTSANITTANGDVAGFVSLGSGDWKCAWYQRGDGTPLVGGTPTPANALSGSVIQVVNTQTGAVATGTTVIPLDDTIPQNTEGNEYMTRAITPNNTSNNLKIDIVLFMSNSGSANHTAALFQDSTANALAVGQMVPATGNSLSCIKFTHFMSAGTTSSTTFKVRAGGHAAGTTTFNGTAGGRLFGGILESSITITEIKA